MVGFRTPATLGKGNELETGLHASRSSSILIGLMFKWVYKDCKNKLFQKF